MRAKRLCALFLSLLLLVGSITACASPEGADETEASSKEAANVTEGEETELRDSLPDDLDYGEDEVTFISRFREGWSSGELTVPELNNETVNDAVYERNRAVEERLNIRIQNIEIDTSDYDEVATKVKLAVQGNSRDYDLMASPVNGAVPVMLDGVLFDLKQLDYLDLEKPWWSQGINDTASYGDSQFVATGSVVLSMYRFAFVTVFNQRLFTDANQPFLYEHVENGSWTLDKQISLVPLFHKDDGNGLQDPDRDVFGFLTGDVISTDSYWSSCEISILRPDEDDGLVMDFDSAKLQDVMEKLLTLCYVTDQSTYVFHGHGSDDEQTDIRHAFATGNGAMATLRILELENQEMRSMTDKYGVVPMPKFSEEQKEYHTFLHNQFTVLAVLTTVEEARRNEMGAVLEALASESHRVVRPAYYEKTLRTTLAQDPESAAMMEIIANNVHMDKGVFYSRQLGDFYKYPRTVVQTKNNDIISYYAGLNVKWRRDLRQLLTRLDKITSENQA